MRRFCEGIVSIIILRSPFKSLNLNELAHNTEKPKEKYGTHRGALICRFIYSKWKAEYRNPAKEVEFKDQHFEKREMRKEKKN